MTSSSEERSRRRRKKRLNARKIMKTIEKLKKEMRELRSSESRKRLRSPSTSSSSSGTSSSKSSRSSSSSSSEKENLRNSSRRKSQRFRSKSVSSNYSYSKYGKCEDGSRRLPEKFHRRREFDGTKRRDSKSKSSRTDRKSVEKPRGSKKRKSVNNDEKAENDESKGKLPVKEGRHDEKSEMAKDERKSLQGEKTAEATMDIDGKFVKGKLMTIADGDNEIFDAETNSIFEVAERKELSSTERITEIVIDDKQDDYKSSEKVDGENKIVSEERFIANDEKTINDESLAIETAKNMESMEIEGTLNDDKSAKDSAKADDKVSDNIFAEEENTLTRSVKDTAVNFQDFVDDKNTDSDVIPMVENVYAKQNGAKNDESPREKKSMKVDEKNTSAEKNADVPHVAVARKSYAKRKIHERYDKTKNEKSPQKIQLEDEENKMSTEDSSDDVNSQKQKCPRSSLYPRCRLDYREFEETAENSSSVDYDEKSSKIVNAIPLSTLSEFITQTKQKIRDEFSKAKSDKFDSGTQDKNLLAEKSIIDEKLPKDRTDSKTVLKAREEDWPKKMIEKNDSYEKSSSIFESDEDTSLDDSREFKRSKLNSTSDFVPNPCAKKNVPTVQSIVTLTRKIIKVDTKTAGEKIFREDDCKSRPRKTHEETQKQICPKDSKNDAKYSEEKFEISGQILKNSTTLDESPKNDKKSKNYEISKFIVAENSNLSLAETATKIEEFSIEKRDFSSKIITVEDETAVEKILENKIDFGSKKNESLPIGDAESAEKVSIIKIEDQENKSTIDRSKIVTGEILSNPIISDTDLESKIDETLPIEDAENAERFSNIEIENQENKSTVDKSKISTGEILSISTIAKIDPESKIDETLPISRAKNIEKKILIEASDREEKSTTEKATDEVFTTENLPIIENISESKIDETLPISSPKKIEKKMIIEASNREEKSIPEKTTGEVFTTENLPIIENISESKIDETLPISSPKNIEKIMIIEASNREEKSTTEKTTGEVFTTENSPLIETFSESKIDETLPTPGAEDIEKKMIIEVSDREEKSTTDKATGEVFATENLPIIENISESKIDETLPIAPAAKIEKNSLEEPNIEGTLTPVKNFAEFIEAFTECYEGGESDQFFKSSDEYSESSEEINLADGFLPDELESEKDENSSIESAENSEKILNVEDPQDSEESTSEKVDTASKIVTAKRSISPPMKKITEIDSEPQNDEILPIVNAEKTEKNLRIEASSNEEKCPRDTTTSKITLDENEKKSSTIYDIIKRFFSADEKKKVPKESSESEISKMKKFDAASEIFPVENSSVMEEIEENDSTIKIDETEENKSINIDDSETEISNDKKVDPASENSSMMDETKEIDSTLKIDETEESDWTLKIVEMEKNDMALKINETEENDSVLKIGKVEENDSMLKIVEMEENDSTLKIHEMEANDTMLKIGETEENDDMLKIDEMEENDSTLKIVEMEENDSTLKIVEMEENYSTLKTDEMERKDSSLKIDETEENDSSLKIVETEENDSTLKIDESLLPPLENMSVEISYVDDEESMKVNINPPSEGDNEAMPKIDVSSTSGLSEDTEMNIATEISSHVEKSSEANFKAPSEVFTGRISISTEKIVENDKISKSDISTIDCAEDSAMTIATEITRHVEKSSEETFKAPSKFFTDQISFSTEKIVENDQISKSDISTIDPAEDSAMNSATEISSHVEKSSEENFKTPSEVFTGQLSFSTEKIVENDKISKSDISTIDPAEVSMMNIATEISSYVEIFSEENFKTPSEKIVENDKISQSDKSIIDSPDSEMKMDTEVPNCDQDSSIDKSDSAIEDLTSSKNSSMNDSESKIESSIIDPAQVSQMNNDEIEVSSVDMDSSDGKSDSVSSLKIVAAPIMFTQAPSVDLDRQSKNDESAENSSKNIITKFSIDIELSNDISKASSEFFTPSSSAMEEQNAGIAANSKTEESSSIRNYELAKLNNFAEEKISEICEKLEKDAEVSTIIINDRVSNCDDEFLREKSVQMKTSEKSIENELKLSKKINFSLESFEDTTKNMDIDNSHAEVESSRDKSKVESEILEAKNRSKIESEIVEEKNKSQIESEILEEKDKSKIESKILEEKNRSKIESEILDEKNKSRIETILDKNSTEKNILQRARDENPQNFEDSENEEKIDSPIIDLEIAADWMRIMERGLSKIVKEHLTKKYVENSFLPKARSLNSELKRFVSGILLEKDQQFVSTQRQLAAAITALGKSLTEIKEKKLSASLVENLSEVGQILANLHHENCVQRRSCLVPRLGVLVGSFVDENRVDNFLFDSEDSEVIDARSSSNNEENSEKENIENSTNISLEAKILNAITESLKTLKESNEKSTKDSSPKNLETDSSREIDRERAVKEKMISDEEKEKVLLQKISETIFESETEKKAKKSVKKHLEIDSSKIDCEFSSEKNRSNHSEVGEKMLTKNLDSESKFAETSIFFEESEESDDAASGSKNFESEPQKMDCEQSWTIESSSEIFEEFPEEFNNSTSKFASREKSSTTNIFRVSAEDPNNDCIMTFARLAKKCTPPKIENRENIYEAPSKLRNKKESIFEIDKDESSAEKKWTEDFSYEDEEANECVVTFARTAKSSVSYEIENSEVISQSSSELKNREKSTETSKEKCAKPILKTPRFSGLSELENSEDFDKKDSPENAHNERAGALSDPIKFAEYSTTLEEKSDSRASRIFTPKFPSILSKAINSESNIEERSCVGSSSSGSVPAVSSLELWQAKVPQAISKRTEASSSCLEDRRKFTEPSSNCESNALKAHQTSFKHVSTTRCEPGKIRLIFSKDKATFSSSNYSPISLRPVSDNLERVPIAQRTSFGQCSTPRNEPQDKKKMSEKLFQDRQLTSLNSFPIGSSSDKFETGSTNQETSFERFSTPKNDSRPYPKKFSEKIPQDRQSTSSRNDHLSASIISGSDNFGTGPNAPETSFGLFSQKISQDRKSGISRSDHLSASFIYGSDYFETSPDAPETDSGLFSQKIRQDRKSGLSRNDHSSTLIISHSGNFRTSPNAPKTGFGLFSQKIPQDRKSGTSRSDYSSASIISRSDNFGTGPNGPETSFGQFPSEKIDSKKCPKTITPENRRDNRFESSRLENPKSSHSMMDNYESSQKSQQTSFGRYLTAKNDSRKSFGERVSEYSSIPFVPISSGPPKSCDDKNEDRRSLRTRAKPLSPSRRSPIARSTKPAIGTKSFVARCQNNRGSEVSISNLYTVRNSPPKSSNESKKSTAAKKRASESASSIFRNSNVAEISHTQLRTCQGSSSWNLASEDFEAKYPFRGNFYETMPGRSDEFDESPTKIGNVEEEIEKIPEAWGTVKVQARGAGYAILQMTVQYNVDREKFQTPPATKAFDLRVIPNFYGRNQSHINYFSCQRWTNVNESSRSGMAVLDVTIPTGYIIQQQNLDKYILTRQVRNLQRARFQDRKVLFYFDYLDQEETCVNFTIERWFPVANMSRYLPIRVYDYYAPERFNETIFDSLSTYILNICEVCGSSQCPYCHIYNAASLIVPPTTLVLLLSVFTATARYFRTQEFSFG